MRPRILITASEFDKPPLPLTVLGTYESYIETVLEAGGSPFTLPLSSELEALRTIYDIADGVILPGGEDISPMEYKDVPHENLGATDRRRDFVELTLCRWAIEDNKPLLAIARGMQLLNIALNGTLYQDLPSEAAPLSSHPVDGEWEELSHVVNLSVGSVLHSCYGVPRIEVNSIHHQGIAKLGTRLKASAESPDGLVEGVEIPDHRFVVGVQWHPETLWQHCAPEHLKLFESFIKVCTRTA